MSQRRSFSIMTYLHILDDEGQNTTNLIPPKALYIFARDNGGAVLFWWHTIEVSTEGLSSSTWKLYTEQYWYLLHTRITRKRELYTIEQSENIRADVESSSARYWDTFLFLFLTAFTAYFCVTHKSLLLCELLAKLQLHALFPHEREDHVWGFIYTGCLMLILNILQP